MQQRNTWILVGVVVLVVLVLGILVGSMMMGPGMMGWGGYGWGWWGILMGIAMLLFWVLVIGGIAWLVISLLRQGQPAVSTGGGRALDILQERYAKGEITREQYEQMRRDLEG